MIKGLVFRVYRLELRWQLRLWGGYWCRTPLGPRRGGAAYGPGLHRLLRIHGREEMPLESNKRGLVHLPSTGWWRRSRERSSTTHTTHTTHTTYTLCRHLLRHIFAWGAHGAGRGDCRCPQRRRGGDWDFEEPLALERHVHVHAHQPRPRLEVPAPYGVQC
jgi:hypothetical protein